MIVENRVGNVDKNNGSFHKNLWKLDFWKIRLFLMIF